MISVCYIDCDPFGEFVSAQKDVPIFSLAKQIATKGVSKLAYNMRVQQLSPVFGGTHKLIGNVKIIDCQTTAMFMASQCLGPVPCYEETRKCSSPICPKVSSSRMFPVLEVGARRIEQSGLHSLQSVISSRFEYHHRNTKCRERMPQSLEQRSQCFYDPSVSKHVLCDGDTSFTYTIEDHFFIECAGGIGQKDHNIEQFPNTLTILEKKFHLRSIVAFVPPASAEGIGHYVTYCRRLRAWEKYDDLNNKPVCVKSSTKVVPHLVLYTKEV